MKNQTIIIAEAGVNHNGSIIIAKKLIDVAATAGVDYIKFQTFIAEKNISVFAEKASYQIANTGNELESQLDMVKKLELSFEDHDILIDYCKEKGVKFLSTAFDFESIDYLKNKIDFFKIPSGEVTNLPYLERVAKLGLPIVMSTGMSSMEEVQRSFEILLENGASQKDITILHCNTEYPTPIKDVNLNAMISIGDKLGVDIGYSDHTLGIEVATAAVALGAKVIEKHFTLDKNMSGPDHKASLEPNELINMVNQIRNIEKAMGSSVKEPTPSEFKNIAIARKSIVAIKSVKKGEKFTLENLGVKRPGKGISPMKWYEVLGTLACRDFEPDELIEL